MNVLVANISVLHKGEPNKYSVVGLDCAVTEIEAKETNESILKCVVNLDAVINTGGLNKIIALVSNDVLNKRDNYLQMSAFEYFLECAGSLGISKENVIEIHIENGKSPREINLILDDICRNISSEDTVYIDGAGGLRTINNVIQLLTKILKYTGIKNPCTLYADVQNRPNCLIYDTKNFDKMTDLADAFNEFMTSGKSEQLRQCIKNAPNDSVLNLVNLMCEFSDKIRLGNIDDIEVTVNNLNDAALKVENENDSSCMESVIIRRFIPVIREKFIGENKRTDYCRLVNWCLENSLVQQAVTIFTEKIPVYLFDHNILVLNKPDLFANYEAEKKENKLLPVHWQTKAVFYSILGDQYANNPLSIEFKNWNEKRIPPKNPKIKALISSISKISFPVKKGSNDLEKFCAAKGYTSKTALINDLISNQKKYLELLGEPVVGDKVRSDKFLSVDYILNHHKLITSDFSYKVSHQQIANILYGYLYVKNIRNRINHATDAEMFTESQKEKLKDYDFSKFDLETIKKNIFIALNSIMDITTEKIVKEENQITAPIENTTEKIDKEENQISAPIEDVSFSTPQIVSTPQFCVKILGKIDISKFDKKRK